MPLATSARAAAACSLAGLATDTDGANVLDGASAMTYKEEYNKKNESTIQKHIQSYYQNELKSYSQQLYVAAVTPRRW